MKQLIIAELQKLQKKATENFTEAEKENNALGAGYFYISKKIHSLIGTIQGFEKTTSKKLESLRDMYKQAKTLTEKYGSYKVELICGIDNQGVLYYKCYLYGTIKAGSGSFDTESIYNKESFPEILSELEVRLKKDVEARNDLPTEDVKVK